MVQTKYNTISENPESTVIAKYVSTGERSEHYQSENELEWEFIKQLEKQSYEYANIKTEADLITNLRKQLAKLNDYVFTDSEWEQFFRSELSNPNQSIKEKTKTIQEDHIKLLRRDDGTTKNIYLIDKQHIHNNHLQVINQYAEEDGQRRNRYDVTILVNGLPLVHIELKRRGVSLQEAFNQINRYQRESFWAGSGLFEYVQLFVISNGTFTKYYSNTTRNQHIAEQAKANSKDGKKTSNSYEFTSWWADADNKQITDLMDFAKTFFAKHSLLNVLTKYCIFTSDELLLVMRPYQIVATERILERMNISNNYKTYGSVQGGGYIWHTTGSGKTLTSFKTAQSASKLSFIDKVLFVVDRKDLDYQTMKEYDKFEKGAANSNTSTAILAKQLESSDIKIIITTIQKLDIFVTKNKKHPIFDKRIVLIFDECHRSQFGDMHKAITNSFKKYHLFGFTGTPIFTENSGNITKPNLATTEQAFGDKLHTYTIVDAIQDKNVLPFRVEYFSTMREKENIEDAKVWDIDREKALASPKRISNIVGYILEHFNKKTKRNDKSYIHNVVKNVDEVVSARDRLKVEDVKEQIRLSGFNSIFAVSSIDVAKKYYTEFQKQLAELSSDRQLKVAIIYSFGVNEAEPELDGLFDENSEDTSKLDKSSRDFLEEAIKDYNAIFKTDYDTSSDKFQNYYKDVSQRVKNREIDLLIVVNMFLTGFDATTLNTLWVDKNLRLHGLLQAYSRTNRILNSVKTFGNIVCFRDLEKATNDSIALFGNREAGGIVLLKTYKEYYNGYENDGKHISGYIELLTELQQNFPVGKDIIGEQNEKDFIKLYGAILKIRNILSVFDDFAGNEILTERDVQNYHSKYIDLYEKFRKNNRDDKENVNDDIVFEMELIKQVDINIDYILELIRKYQESKPKDKEIRVSITRNIDASVELRNKKKLIEQFIDSLNDNSNIEDDWHTFANKKRTEELEDIIKTNNLNKEETYKFIKNAFRDGYVQTTGTRMTDVLPPISRFEEHSNFAQIRENVLDEFKLFFDRYIDITGA